MAMMTDSTFRPEFELATNTELSDFPNVEAKREEQRNCLKHVVGRIDVFAICDICLSVDSYFFCHVHAEIMF